MFFIKYEYVLIELRKMVLETINNVIFIFSSYLVITTAQSWHIHFSFVNFMHISCTITHNKYQQKNGTLSAPKNPTVWCSQTTYVTIYIVKTYPSVTCTELDNNLILIIPLVIARSTSPRKYFVIS